MAGKLIGTLAKEFRVNSRTLRFYEAVRLLPPPARTDSGYRIYGDDAERRLAFIAKAKSLGLSLKEIREILILREDGERPCDSVQQILTDHVRRIDEQMTQLQAFRADLHAMLTECRARKGNGGIDVRESVCPVIEALATGRTVEPRDGGENDHDQDSLALPILQRLPRNRD